jgi:hypothetical protein
MDLRYTGLEGVDWIHVAQVRDQCRVLAKRYEPSGFTKGEDLLG